MRQLGTIQPRTFVQVDCHYTATTARCICQSTITLNVDGEWRHGHLDAYGNRDPWCRPQR